jgi:uncharacterized membrane protein (UPF0127 family)
MRDIFRIWNQRSNCEASLGGVPLRLRVLVSPEEQQKGFMFEPEPDDGFGLFFVYPEPRELGFWMQNVPFDLDLIPLDEDMRVMGVHRLIADDERTCKIKRPCRYVLELAAGWCERNGIGRGARLEINEQYDEQ